MTTTLTPKATPPALPPGVKLLGQVISWTCPSGTVPFTALLEALREAGLDESAARALAPRHAFSRACKKLAKQRIIRQTAEDADTITFQLTSESRAAHPLDYTPQTILTLATHTRV